LRGAKDEGFETLLISDEKRRRFYERFGLADEILIVNDFKDILDEDTQEKLIEKNVILVPHGSFVEYIGAKALSELKVPLFGNKRVLEWESDREKSFEWFRRAGIKMPIEFKKPEDIDRLCIVKLGGAKGGRGYKLVRSADEFYREFGELKEGMVLQEYIVGTRFYPSFFYSPLSKENDLFSIDIRYESNADALSRLPSTIRVDPTYVVTGNLPVVMRESLLPTLFDYADSLVERSKELFPPGLYGPYCLELCCTNELEFYLFEISARIVAGTNVWIPYAPYAYLKYGEAMTMGRRIAMEIKEAEREGRMKEIVS
jgi:5-formaminoimidazole-4-carboxamide-1-(beta)-D-ribofuranosyl 5'-monophosphate synthetase